jgi:hypothetical protein
VARKIEGNYIVVAVGENPGMKGVVNVRAAGRIHRADVKVSAINSLQYVLYSFIFNCGAEQ